MRLGPLRSPSLHPSYILMIVASDWKISVGMGVVVLSQTRPSPLDHQSTMRPPSTRTNLATFQRRLPTENRHWVPTMATRRIVHILRLMKVRSSVAPLRVRSSFNYHVVMPPSGEVVLLLHSAQSAGEMAAPIRLSPC